VRRGHRAAAPASPPTFLESPRLACRPRGLLGPALLALLVAGRAFAAVPEDPRALLQEGIKLHDEGRYDDAIAVYRRALALDPGNVEVVYELAFSQQSAGKFRECAETAEPALKKSGEMKPAFYGLLASCVDSAGDPKRANKIFDKALREYPRFQMLLFNAGLTRLRTKEPIKAKELLKKSVEVQPFHGSSHLYLAVAFEQAGYRVPALLAYFRFLSLGLDDPRAFEAARSVVRLLDRGLEKTGDQSYTITLPSAAPTDEGDWSMVELMLPMSAAVVTTEEWAKRSAGEKLVYRIDSALGIIEEAPAPKKVDFARATYLPFTRALRAAKLVEPFVYEFFAPLGIPGMREWRDAHPEEIKALRAFLAEHARS
jgi:tetratricopeptide (TPR) repeat protein